jgi:FkbM family methyltransferase
MMLERLVRKIPPFKGKLRLCNLLLNRNATNILIETRSGKFLLPNLQDNQYFELFCNGVYEKDLVNFIIDNLPGNGIMLDIGGNIGSITIPVALARPDIKIFAIEAFSRTFSFLETNVKLNKLTNVVPLNICLSNEVGRVMNFYIDKKLLGSSSFHSLRKEAERVEMTTNTLDALLEDIEIGKIDLLKIDTEGSEAMIFKGAMSTICQSKPIILFEFNQFYERAVEGLKVGDSQELLIDMGYKIFDFERYPILKEIDSVRKEGFGNFLALHNSE